MKLIVPYYYRLYERDGTRWFVNDASAVVYNGSSQPLNLQNVEQEFGLTEGQVVVELFRINGGRAGYYLANLKDRQYHYCGLNLEDVRKALHALGIGRSDPMDA